MRGCASRARRLLTTASLAFAYSSPCDRKGPSSVPSTYLGRDGSVRVAVMSASQPQSIAIACYCLKQLMTAGSLITTEDDPRSPRHPY